MTDKDNIVLITIDSLRADYCGFMGGVGETPTLDRFADEGLAFTNAIAPGPATADSVPIIFTGDDTHARRADASLKTTEWIPHHMRARTTIPERLSERGYTTGAFTANPWTSRYFGFDQGFDHFEDFIDTDRSRGLIERTIETGDGLHGGSKALEGLRLLVNWTQETNMFQSWDSFYDDVVAWTQQAPEPYFLWIFLVDVHMPYLPPSGFRSVSAPMRIASNLWLYLGGSRGESTFKAPLLSSYADTVRYVDDRLGRLATDLRETDPVFVVHADHGEEFGEHGVYGHGHHLCETQIHSPLVVWQRSGGPRGRVDAPVSLATMPELLSAIAAGRDLTTLAAPVVKSRNGDPKYTARGQTWKYVRDEAGDEAVYDVRDGTDREIRDEDRLAVGRDAVDRWIAHENECQLVTTAARDVSREFGL